MTPSGWNSVSLPCTALLHEFSNPIRSRGNRPIVPAICDKLAGKHPVISGPDILIFKLGHRENQIRPLRVKTGQSPHCVLSELRHLIFQIRTERFILGVLGPQRSEISISASQATDRSTFCPMPGGRSQAASDGRPTEAVLLGKRGRQLRRPVT